MASEVKFKLINKLSQGLPILLKSGNVLVSRLLPSRESLTIDAAEFSQDILDKSNRGYLTVEATNTTAPAPVAKPLPAPSPVIRVVTPTPAPAPAKVAGDK